MWYKIRLVSIVIRKQEWVKVSLLAGRLSDFPVSITRWEKLVHLSVGLGFNSISCQPNTDWRWTGRGSASAQRLAIGFLLQHSPSRHSLHAHSLTSFSSLPSFPTPSLLIHSERQQQQQRCLSRTKDCNELILFSLQLHNCPGFLATAAAVASLSLTHTHTVSHTHMHSTHTHTHTHTHTLMLDPSKHLVHFYACMWTLLHHSWPFSCVRLLSPFFVVVVFNLDQHLISFPVYSGALSQWII